MFVKCLNGKSQFKKEGDMMRLLSGRRTAERWLKFE